MAADRPLRRPAALRPVTAAGPARLAAARAAVAAGVVMTIAPALAAEPPVPSTERVAKSGRIGATPSTSATAASPLAWHDGGVRRPLVVDPSLEADFAPRAGRNASPIRPAGTVGKSASALSSPVLRDDTGRLRALPGGVLVVLAAPADEAGARALIARAGAVPVRALGSTTWLVEAPAGLASLELANRLHASGLFASAQPNWWVARTLK
jgi:hypothetical protein